LGTPLGCVFDIVGLFCGCKSESVPPKKSEVLIKYTQTIAAKPERPYDKFRIGITGFSVLESLNILERNF